MNLASQSPLQEVGTVDPLELRRTFGSFATGVTVVTTRDRHGRRVGMTANSFSSLSLDPPLLLWSVARKSPSFDHFAEASHFAINVLAADQQHLSKQFSTPAEDKFADIGCDEGLGGVPLLPGVIACFECETAHRYEGGDHVIIIGRVERCARFHGEPLVFHAGAYRETVRNG